MKKRVSFIAYVTIEVDPEDEIVQEYESISELVDDVVGYKFSPVLPVIANGAVTVEDINYDNIEIF